MSQQKPCNNIQISALLAFLFEGVSCLQALSRRPMSVGQPPFCFWVLREAETVNCHFRMAVGRDIYPKKSHWRKYCPHRQWAIQMLVSNPHSNSASQENRLWSFSLLVYHCGKSTWTWIKMYIDFVQKITVLLSSVNYVGLIELTLSVLLLAEVLSVWYTIKWMVLGESCFDRYDKGPFTTTVRD